MADVIGVFLCTGVLHSINESAAEADGSYAPSVKAGRFVGAKLNCPDVRTIWVLRELREDDPAYLAIDVDGLGEGICDLVVDLRDVNSGDAANRSMVFRVEV
jgi:hypothetical protein